MPITRCPSPACARPFKVNSYTLSADTSKEPGKISCPHCGVAISGDANYIFLTHALSKAQEARFIESLASGSAEDLPLDTRFLDTRPGK